MDEHEHEDEPDALYGCIGVVVVAAMFAVLSVDCAHVLSCRGVSDSAEEYSRCVDENTIVMGVNP